MSYCRKPRTSHKLGVACMQAFLPLLGTDLTLRGEPGRLINNASIFGGYGLPFSVRA